MSKPAWTLFALIITIFAVFAVVNLFGPTSSYSPAREITLNELYDLARGKEMKSASIAEGSVSGELVNGERVVVYGVQRDGEMGAEVLKMLMDNGVVVTLEKPPSSSIMLGLLSVLAFPLMILALIYFLVLRPATLNRPSVTQAQLQAAEMEAMRQELREIRSLLEEQRRASNSTPRS